MKRTPLPLWSDGIHFVRRAGDTDPHPMRWVVGFHRNTSSTYMRHAPTMDEALEQAIAATTAHIKKHPDDEALFTAPLLPAASALQGEKKRRGRPPGPEKLKAFSTYNFNCIRANPVAQVWQCVSLPGEHAPVGRRSVTGRAPQQSSFLHTKGECAVMKHREPIRDANGEVRVFKSWQVAEDYALELYATADEEERLYWVEPEGRVVGRTENVDIIFDPTINGVKRPFSLWLPRWNKPVYAGWRKKNYAKAGKLHEGGTYMPGTKDDKDALAFNLKLAALDERKVLTTEIATFESIWGAEEHATNVTERVLRGEKVDV